MKRYLLAVLAVFVTWSILDFLIHGVILMSLYEASAEIWRPEEEMMNGLLMVVTLLAAASFVGLIAKFSKEKSPKAGALFGLIWGLGGGVSMGYGTYAFLPLPYMLALGWFLAHAVQGTISGLVAGLVLKEQEA